VTKIRLSRESKDGLAEFLLSRRRLITTADRENCIWEEMTLLRAMGCT
jgi:hypothetical protein